MKNAELEGTVVLRRLARDYVNPANNGQACFVKFFTSWERTMEDNSAVELSGGVPKIRFMPKHLSRARPMMFFSAIFVPFGVLAAFNLLTGAFWQGNSWPYAMIGLAFAVVLFEMFLPSVPSAGSQSLTVVFLIAAYFLFQMSGVLDEVFRVILKKSANGYFMGGCLVISALFAYRRWRTVSRLSSDEIRRCYLAKRFFPER